MIGKKTLCLLLAVMTIFGSCFACAETAPSVYIDGVAVEGGAAEDESALHTEGAAALPDLMNPTAPGELVEENSKARVRTGEGISLGL